MLKSLLKEKNYAALNKRLDQIIDLVVVRAKLGIVDADKGVLTKSLPTILSNS